MFDPLNETNINRKTAIAFQVKEGDYIEIGQENVIDYSACRGSGNICVTPPTCNGDGYCPEVAFSSYIIVSY